MNIEKRLTSSMLKSNNLSNIQYTATKKQMIFNDITLIIVYDSIHNIFEIKTASFLYFDNKDLKEILKIVISTKTAIIIMRDIGQMMDLAIRTKKKTRKIRIIYKN